MGCLTAPASCVGKIILPLFDRFYAIVKEQLRMFAWGFFWVLCYVLLTCVSILPSTLYCLDFLSVFMVYV